MKKPFLLSLCFLLLSSLYMVEEGESVEHSFMQHDHSSLSSQDPRLYEVWQKHSLRKPYNLDTNKGVLDPAYTTAIPPNTPSRNQTQARRNPSATQVTQAPKPAQENVTNSAQAEEIPTINSTELKQSSEASIQKTDTQAQEIQKKTPENNNTPPSLATVPAHRQNVGVKVPTEELMPTPRRQANQTVPENNALSTPQYISHAVAHQETHELRTGRELNTEQKSAVHALMPTLDPNTLFQEEGLRILRTDENTHETRQALREQHEAELARVAQSANQRELERMAQERADAEKLKQELMLADKEFLDAKKREFDGETISIQQGSSYVKYLAEKAREEARVNGLPQAGYTEITQ